MSIPEEAIEAVRLRTDIVDIISQYVALRKQGRGFVGLCPFHTEKTPSFTVAPERQSWHCFGCGQGGNVFTFLMRIDGLTFPEAVERLAARAGIPITRDPQSIRRRSQRERVFEVNQAAAAFFVEQLKGAPRARHFLEGRGLAEKTVAALGIGYAPDAWDALSSALLQQGMPGALLEAAGLSLPRDSGGYYDRFRDRVVFPIQDVEGRVVGFGGRALGDVQPKYLNSPETPVFDKSRTLYGLDRARRAIAEAGVAVVVEGYVDAAMAYQYGVANVVATLGTALGESHLRVLQRYAPKVVLAFDGDAAGAAAAERSLPLFEAAEVEGRILVLPGGKDPDEFLREQGAEAFRRLVEGALPIVEYQLRRLSSRGDQRTPEGRSALARAAAPVLAGIRSRVKREEYIRRLAEEWCAGQLHRVREVEAAIRSEVARSGDSGPRAAARRAPAAGPSPAGQPGASVEVVAPVSPRVASAERYVLSGLLLGVVRGSEVFAEVTAADFAVPAHRRLAEVLARVEDGDDPLRAIGRAAGMEDETLAALLARLAAEQEKVPVTQKTVQDCVWVIKERKLRARISGLQELLMRPDFGPGEERARVEAEICQLVRELSNRNAGQAGPP